MRLGKEDVVHAVSDFVFFLEKVHFLKEIALEIDITRV